MNQKTFRFWAICWTLPGIFLLANCGGGAGGESSSETPIGAFASGWSINCVDPVNDVETPAATAVEVVQESADLESGLIKAVDDDGDGKVESLSLTIQVLGQQNLPEMIDFGGGSAVGQNAKASAYVQFVPAGNMQESVSLIIDLTPNRPDGHIDFFTGGRTATFNAEFSRGAYSGIVDIGTLGISSADKISFHAYVLWNFGDGTFSFASDICEPGA